MNQSDIGPLVIVISREEVERQDLSGPLSVLKSLLKSRESIRGNMTNVDIAFSGYDSTSRELFEISQVRDYVQSLDAQFCYWLYFLSRSFMGLQCLALCFLPPHLTEEARQRIHMQKLTELIERRWGPAMYKLCSAAGHSEAEADELMASAAVYFTSGRTQPNP
jgi:hypothetical protein